MRLGIDVGGTHTDLVAVDQHEEIIYAKKMLTTQDVLSGIRRQLKDYIKCHSSKASAITGVFIGTTFGLNALLQARSLKPVGLIRIDSKEMASIPAAHNWAEGLTGYIVGERSISGGYQCDGREIQPFCEQSCKIAVLSLLEAGAEAFSISSPFSPLYSAQELQAKEIIQKIHPDITVSCSHALGGIGVLARENSALCNSMLKEHFREHFKGIKECLAELGIRCPLWISQNNGTTTTLEAALDNPMLTLSSGPTNSFVGAARLCGLEEAIVIDIGGTSTDIGVIQKGYPIPSGRYTNINGVSLNFQMPDVCTLALGGGSVVEAGELSEQSVGNDLLSKGQAFGGNTLTLTDAAIAAGYLSMGEQALSLSQQEGERIVAQGVAKIVAQLEKRPLFSHLPIILVGGGAALFSPALFPGKEILRPPHCSVANAYGAALGELSCRHDGVISLDKSGVNIQKIQEVLKQRLGAAGAQSNSIRCIEQEILPFHYMPTPTARVQITLAGKIQSLSTA